MAPCTQMIATSIHRGVHRQTEVPGASLGPRLNSAPALRMRLRETVGRSGNVDWREAVRVARLGRSGTRTPTTGSASARELHRDRLHPQRRVAPRPPSPTCQAHGVAVPPYCVVASPDLAQGWASKRLASTQNWRLCGFSSRGRPSSGRVSRPELPFTHSPHPVRSDRSAPARQARPPPPAGCGVLPTFACSATGRRRRVAGAMR